MNKKTLSIAIILISLSGILIFACEEQKAPPSGENAQTIEEKTPTAAADTSVEMLGMVQRSESGGLILADGQNHYDLQCDSDLSSLIGRRVKVTGILKTDGADSFIKVVQAVEASADLTE